MYTCTIDEWLLNCIHCITDIHSITPSMGSVRGGTLITVTGTGFEVDGPDDVALDIDGIPCRVRKENITVDIHSQP